MTFDELLVEASAELLQMRIRLSTRHEGGLIEDLGERRGSRRDIAALILRIGAWLDHEEAERFLIARRTS
jgi:hypothetical protein